MILELTLNVTPKPLPRARLTARKGYVASYYTRDTQDIFDDYENAILTALNEQGLTSSQVIDKISNTCQFITLDVVFYMPIPSSWSKKRKSEANRHPHVSKPDLDNLVKLILDRAEGILFDNDNKIAEINARKVYDHEPQIYMKIYYEM